MASRKFAHGATFTVARGRVRVTCACGWMGERCDTQEDAERAYAQHVGHREKKPRTVLDLSIDPDDLMMGTMELMYQSQFPPAHLH